MLHVCQPNHFFRSHFHSQRGNIAHANYSIPMEHFKSNFVSCIFNLRWKKQFPEDKGRSDRKTIPHVTSSCREKADYSRIITSVIDRSFSNYSGSASTNWSTRSPHITWCPAQRDTQVCAVKQYDLVLCFQRWHPIFRIITNLFYSRDQQAGSNVSVWLSLQWTLPVYHAT